MTRISVQGAAGLPLCAVLETWGGGETWWIRNLPLTEQQERQLDGSAEILSYCTARYISGSVTALVQVTGSAARRIYDGEPWHTVLLGPCPLAVVPRED